MSQKDIHQHPSAHYKKAGVDLEAGDALVEKIKPLCQQTHRDGVLGSIGGFAGLFDLSKSGYRAPVMLTATDGVGTKLRLAQRLNKHDTIGIDLVAMCVNDILAQGGEPVVFLDYLACGKLNVKNMQTVVRGIAQGCQDANTALIGGETAEMPECYPPDEYDLAGFAVGLAEREQLLGAENVKAGDMVIGIGSSGLHSNGYTLINKLIADHRIALETPFAGSTLGSLLLEPTLIYVSALLPLIKQGKIHALAHITGGGISANLPRALPNYHRVSIARNSWERPIIFDWLQDESQLQQDEMLNVFNCGIGMVLITAQQYQETVMQHLSTIGLSSWLIAEVERCAEEIPHVIYY